MAGSKRIKLNKIPKNVQARALFEHIDEKVGLVIEQFGGINRKLDSHTEMLGSVKVDLEIVKADIEFIKHSLKKKVDIDEFATLERRVALLEKRA
jgi:hypothetical protein